MADICYLLVYIERYSVKMNAKYKRENNLKGVLKHAYISVAVLGDSKMKSFLLALMMNGLDANPLDYYT